MTFKGKKKYLLACYQQDPSPDAAEKCSKLHFKKYLFQWLMNRYDYFTKFYQVMSI